MKHVLFTLYGCDAELLDDEDYIRKTLFEATNHMGATFLKTQSHKFSPQGVTAVTLLAESHISIHTWPEDNICRCDLFSCNVDTNYKKVVEYMKERFHSCEVKRWACDRSDWI